MTIFPNRRLSRVTASVCITLSSWISSGTFPIWAEVRGLCPELRLLWHHRNNLTVDDSVIIWRRRSTWGPLLELLVPKPGRKELFLSYHASLLGGHLGRNRTLARLSHRLYWSGMSDDVKNSSASASCASRGSHQLGDIIHYVIFRPVIAGIILRWTFWTSVILHRTAIATCW